MDPNCYDLPDHNHSDSSSSEECAVCLEKVHKVDMYAKIDSDQEPEKKYHPYCLNDWFSRSKLGLISREDVDSYSVYSAKTVVDTIPVSDSGDNDYHEDQDDEHTILINDQDHDDNNTDAIVSNNDNTSNICIKIICKFLLGAVCFLGLVFTIYVVFSKN
jgi:hypothetical protein